MKFLVSKDIHSNPNFTLLLGFYSLMLFLYFLGDLIYLANFFGYTPEAVTSTLRGNTDEFIEPLSLLSFLEHLHISLFLSILAIFTTMAIVLRLKLSQTHKGLIIALCMASLLISSLALLGSYFISDWLVYIYMATTLLWHVGSLYALFLILFELGFKRR